MDYLISAFKKEQEEKSFRVYVTDCLQVLTSNTVHHATFNGVVEYGSKIKERWVDLLENKKAQPVPEQKEDPRPCTEIAEDMWKRINRKAEK